MVLNLTIHIRLECMYRIVQCFTRTLRILAYNHMHFIPNSAKCNQALYLFVSEL